MHLYIAGPMRGYDRYNFPAFDEAAARLRAQGHAVISPADMDRSAGFDENHEDDLPAGFLGEAARRDVEALLRVEAIALLPGWERSEGARLELRIARWLGLEVFEVIYVIDDREGDRRLELSWLTKYSEALRLADVEAADDERFELTDKGREALGRSFEVRTLGDSEVRIVSATGGAKGSKPQQPQLIPPRFLLALGEVYAFGAGKYPDTEPGHPNWANGYAWSLCYGAMLRHLSAFWSGEWLDPESGLPHVLHAAWHCATLYTFHEEGLGDDDRPNYYRSEGAA